MSSSKFVSDGSDFRIDFAYSPDSIPDSIPNSISYPHPDSISYPQLPAPPHLPAQDWNKHLQRELVNQKDLKEAWDEATRLNLTKQGLTRAEELSITAYTIENFYQPFKKETVNFYDRAANFQSYPYKGMGYYLYHGVGKVAGECPVYEHVYRGLTKSGADKTFNRSVRGNIFTPMMFASASLKLAEAQEFAGADGTILDIQTVCGAYIKPLSKYPGEEEVLIPPSEHFKITKIDANMFRLSSINKERKVDNMDNVVSWCNIS